MKQKMIGITPKLKTQFDGQMIQRKFKKRSKFIEYLLEQDAKN